MGAGGREGRKLNPNCLYCDWLIKLHFCLDVNKSRERKMLSRNCINYIAA